MEAKYAFLVNMKWFLSLLVAINDILLDIGSNLRGYDAACVMEIIFICGKNDMLEVEGSEY